jgi:hypothetical protein
MYCLKMKNFFKKIIILLFVLLISFGANKFALAQTSGGTVGSGAENAGESWAGAATSWVLDQTVEPAAAFVVGMILKFVALLTGISAILLNGVVYYTVVKVSDNYANLAPLNEVWRVIRDVANMAFIFVLLYAAIQTIIGSGRNIKGLIVNIVVVGVLMNFSLFFTKVIIDISNVLALTFYDAITPGSLNAAGTLSLDGVLDQAGLATAFTKHLSLQSLYKIAGALDTGGIITVGIMGSIMLLIAAFVFFAIAIMFVIRYVILILVLILSPIAFVAYVLPDVDQLKKYKNQWWDALINQAFFAPIYFMMTWISLKILGGVMTAFGGTGTVSADALRGLSMGETGPDVTAGAFLMFINFTIVIVLLIASLTTAKDMANKAGGGINKLTGWAMGAAGGATIGMAGRLGRNTVGRAGMMIGESEKLKAAAAQGGAKGFFARQTLTAGRKTGGASFDLRASGIGSQLDAGKAAGKGGFVDYRKKKAEDEEKFSKSLGASEDSIARAERAVKSASTDEERRIAQTKLYGLKGFGDKEVKEQKAQLDEEKKAAINDSADVVVEQGILEEIKETEENLIAAKESDNMEEYEKMAAKLVGLNEDKKRISKTAQKTRERIEEEYEDKKKEVKKVEGAADSRKKKFAESTQNSRWAKFRGYNNEAAAKIRKGKKTAKDLIDEALKDTGEKKDEEPEKKGGDEGEKKTT